MKIWSADFFVGITIYLKIKFLLLFGKVPEETKHIEINVFFPFVITNIERKRERETHVHIHTYAYICICACVSINFRLLGYLFWFGINFK